MIQPEDIRRQAENFYPDFLAAFLNGEDTFFPRLIRGGKAPASDDLPAAIKAVRRLREGSKELRRVGYTVEWREVNSRKFGRNHFPARVLFETQDDYLTFIGKKREFAVFQQAAANLRSAFPQLESWVRSHISGLIEIAEDVPGLLIVLRYFQEHPRPNRFARELPLPVDTKFIGRHERLLREWFDLVLPPNMIRADEEHFGRRFGLRYLEPEICVRMLDDRLRQELGFPCPEFSLPLHTLGALEVRDATVFIVENKVNLMTLPPLPRTVALGALGDGITLLRHVPWLSNISVTYWGDLDVEGFQILSALRAMFPSARSFLMDHQSLLRWRHLAGAGTGHVPAAPPFLTESEQAAFQICRDENVRIEQERITQAEVIRELEAVA